jgi:Nuclease-related domain
VRRRRTRFAGAGGSAERKFSELRRQNVRDQWKIWLVTGLAAIGFAVWSYYAGHVAGLFLAGMSGLIVGVLLVMWSLGGHISAFRWWLGAEGERETAKEIERLGPEWHCEHDLEHEHGNWDHVLVGPAGVFLLDSKLLNGTAAAGADSLKCGRLAYPGRRFRGGAKQIKELLEQRLGFRGPWVQAVVVVWGDFPQRRHEEEEVVYVQGHELASWLSQLPSKVTAPQRAAYVTALREVRESLTTTQPRAGVPSA